MTHLQKSKVYRGGRTARNWTYGTGVISVKGDNDCLSIGFDLDSKGGGITQVLTQINSADFDKIVQEMMRSNKHEALRIMSSAIAEHHS